MSKFGTGKADTNVYAERTDSSTTPNRVYYGLTTTLDASQTDAVWQIWAIDTIGSTTYKAFANDSLAFDKQWSLRDTYFDAISFANSYSMQLSALTNDYLLGPAAAGYNFANTDGFSMAGWIKTTKTSLQTLLNKTSGAANNGYTLDIDASGRVDFEFRGGGTGDRIRVRTDSIVTALNDGGWRFVMVTKASGSTAASSVKIYTGHNGTLTNETLNILNDTLSGVTTSATQIGVGANNTGANPFLGNVDEIAIWNAELTLAEVTEIYNSNNGVIDLTVGSGQVSTALVSWWRMGDGSFISLPTIPDDADANDLTAQAGIVSGDIETEVPP